MQFLSDFCKIFDVDIIRKINDESKRKFQNSGMNTLSRFVCAMIFEGYIMHISDDES